MLYEIAFVSRNEVLHAHCIATATSRPFFIAFCYLLFTLAIMSKNVIPSLLKFRAAVRDRTFCWKLGLKMSLDEVNHLRLFLKEDRY